MAVIAKVKCLSYILAKDLGTIQAVIGSPKYSRAYKTIKDRTRRIQASQVKRTITSELPANCNLTTDLSALKFEPLRYKR